MKSGSDFSFMKMMPGADGADPAAMLKAMQSMQQSWLAAATGQATEAGPAMTDGIDQIDQRISDLQAVEQWLTMNLTMLRSTVQGLQMQRAALASMDEMQKNWQAGMASATGDAKSEETGKTSESAGGAFDPAPFWALLQQQFQTIAQSAMTANANDQTANAAGDSTDPKKGPKGQRPSPGDKA